MSVPEAFQRITAALDQAGIPYMLSGSFASAYYGAPRSTQDIDRNRSKPTTAKNIHPKPSG
jgi:hypothetical protein